MATRNFTPEQLNAINYRGGKLLVAAGAGAGKTSVLVERVVRMLREPGRGLDRLLIVTFTTAAAAEMKERIAAALADGIDSPDTDAQTADLLRRQTMLLDGAQISTIHSFCMKIIKDNLYVIDGLDSGVRPADDAEASLLRADALDDVLEQKYADDSNEAFFTLADCYGMGRDDRNLAELILRVYDFTRATPWPSEWLANMTALFDLGEPGDFGSSVWARRVVGLLKEELDALLSVLRHYDAILLECIKTQKGRDEAADTADGLIGLRAACDKRGGGIDWAGLRGAVLALGDMACLCPRAARGEDLAHRVAREAVKAAVKRFTGGVAKKYFRLDAAGVADEFARSHILLRELSSVVEAFSKRYAEIKRERAVVDYSDLEHLAIQILLKRDDAAGPAVPTDVAKSLQSKYAAVLVDEYQDVNQVQESIIGAVSGGDVFMVGDVKQSIYRFRQAMPEIFTQKYLSYKLYDGAGAVGRDKVVLGKNFRSDVAILDFVNVVFDAIMSKQAGELDYTKDEWLTPGAQTGGGGEGFVGTDGVEAGGGDAAVEIHIIEKAAPAAQEGAGGGGPDGAVSGTDAPGASESGGPGMAVSDGPGTAETDGADEAGYDGSDSQETGDGAAYARGDGDSYALAAEDAGAAELEARLVAAQIKKLMQNARVPAPGGSTRPIAYGDIAVLMRAVKSSAPAFRDELIRLGVPAYTDSSSAYFETYEISVILSLIKIIDNPLQDIPLLTVMLSPVFSFTAEEAALIRNDASARAPNQADARVPEDAAPRAPLYECLLRLTSVYDTSGNADLPISIIDKTRMAVAALEEWRRLSFETPVSALIWRLMHDTGFYLRACAMPGGEQRRANLLRLFDYAREYEKISYKGIFNFIRFVDRMIEQGGDLAEAAVVGENADSVRIMSVHKSKGLEFPAVFLVGCGKRFNFRDSTNSLLLHREAGFGPVYFDPVKRILDDTIAKKQIGALIRNEVIAEEMRILYVALTRAKQRLFLVGTLGNAETYRIKIAERLAPYENADTPDGKLPPDHTLRAGNFLYWIFSAFARSPGQSRFPFYTHSAAGLCDTPTAAPAIAAVPAVPAAVPAAQDASVIHVARATAVPAAQDASAIPAIRVAAVPAAPVAADTKAALDVSAAPAALYPDYSDDLYARLTWQYPYDWLSKIPRKVTVSEIVDARTSARSVIEIADNADNTDEASIFDATEMADYIDDADAIKNADNTVDAPDAPATPNAPVAPVAFSIPDVPGSTLPSGAYSAPDAPATSNAPASPDASPLPGPLFRRELAAPGFMIGVRGFTRAQIGTFTHLVLEKADFSRDIDPAVPSALESLISHLVDIQALLPEQAAAVDRRAIYNFFESEAGRLASSAAQLNRETFFTVKLSLSEYAELIFDKDLLPGDYAPCDGDPFVLMQGAIDCWFIGPDGGIVLIDYKTGFAADKSVSNERNKKYERQIELYALALKKITGRNVGRKFICLLSANKCIEL